MGMSGWFLIPTGCLLVLVAAWWVSRPIGRFWCWSFRLLIAVTLLAMVSPPALVDAARSLVDWFVPGAHTLGSTEGAAFLVHLLLFALISVVLFWQRHDLRALHLFAGLGALALTTEGLQYLIDGRFASWFDVGVNLGGVLFGPLLRRWVPHRRRDS